MYDTALAFYKLIKSRLFLQAVIIMVTHRARWGGVALSPMQQGCMPPCKQPIHLLFLLSLQVVIIMVTHPAWWGARH
jgi:hypothetical protein